MAILQEGDLETRAFESKRCTSLDRGTSWRGSYSEQSDRPWAATRFARDQSGQGGKFRAKGGTVTTLVGSSKRTQITTRRAPGLTLTSSSAVDQNVTDAAGSCGRETT
jgi:hypothetical protein